MPPSALPPFYFAVFAVYEPFLCIVGFLGAILDPKAVSTTLPTRAPDG